MSGEAATKAFKLAVEKVEQAYQHALSNSESEVERAKSGALSKLKL